MSILVLNRFNPQYNPIKKWFRECPEDVILFVPMAYIDFYPKDCFTVVKGFDNYDITASIELEAIQICKEYGIDKIFALDERDIERAGRLRSFLHLKGQNELSSMAYRNKLFMKEILCRDGIPVPPFRKVSSVFDIVDFIRIHDFPILIKPINLYSAMNVEKVNDYQDLLHYLNRIELKDMMIEKYIPYDMVSCNGIVVDNTIVFSSVSIYLKPRIEYQDYLVSITVPDTHENVPIIKDYCKKVISSLPQMENGAFHSEIFINSDRCLLCEIASRSAGGGITACINNSFQFEFYEEWAKTSFVSGYVFPNVNFCKYSASIIIPKKNGQVNKLIETFPFRWVVHHYWEVCVGETIQVSKYNGDKLGVVIVEGNSYEEIINHVDEVKCYIESNIVVN